MTIELRLKKLEAAAVGIGSADEIDLSAATWPELRAAMKTAESECDRLGISQDEPPMGLTRDQWLDLCRAMKLADEAEAAAGADQIPIEQGVAQ